jgi:hypothetical protein
VADASILVIIPSSASQAAPRAQFRCIKWSSSHSSLIVSVLCTVKFYCSQRQHHVIDTAKRALMLAYDPWLRLGSAAN